MLAIVVVNQSIMEWPPLQDNRLSTRPASFRNTLRQGRIGGGFHSPKPNDAKGIEQASPISAPKNRRSVTSLPDGASNPEGASRSRPVSTTAWAPSW